MNDIKRFGYLNPQGQEANYFTRIETPQVADPEKFPDFKSKVVMICLANFYPLKDGQDIQLPKELMKLQDALKRTGDIKIAFKYLHASDQEALRKKIGKSKLNALLKLVSEKNPEKFWQKILDFSKKLQNDHDLDPHVTLATLNLFQKDEVQDSFFPPHADQVRESRVIMETLLSEGNTSERVKYLLQRGLHDALDLRVLGPLLITGMLSEFVTVKTLDKLAALRNSGSKSIFVRGYAPKIIAGMTSYAVEVPFLTISSRLTLEGEHLPAFKDQLVSNAITVGAFRGTGYLNKIVSRRAIGIDPHRFHLGRENLTIIAQVGALYLAHDTESVLGLKPKHDAGQTRFVDSIASVLQLHGGMSFGRFIMRRTLNALDQKNSYDLEKELAIYSERATPPDQSNTEATKVTLKEKIGELFHGRFSTKNQRRIVTLEEEIKQLRQELQKSANTASLDEDANTAHSKKITDLQSERDELSDRIDELNLQIAVLRNSANSADSSIEDLAKITSLETRVEDLTKEKQQFEALLDLYSRENFSLKEELESVKKSLAELEENKTVIDLALDGLRKEKSNLEALLKASETKVSELEGKITALERSKSDLETTMHEKDTRLANQDKSIRSFQNDQEKLAQPFTKQIKLLQAQIDRLSEERVQAKQELSRLQSVDKQARKLEQALTEERKKNEELTGQVYVLGLQLRDFEGANPAVRERMTLRSENAELQEKIANQRSQYKQRLKDLRRQLNDLKKQKSEAASQEVKEETGPDAPPVVIEPVSYPELAPETVTAYLGLYQEAIHAEYGRGETARRIAAAYARLNMFRTEISEHYNPDVQAALPNEALEHYFGRLRTFIERNSEGDIQKAALSDLELLTETQIKVYVAFPSNVSTDTIFVKLTEFLSRSDQGKLEAYLTVIKKNAPKTYDELTVRLYLYLEATESGDQTDLSSKLNHALDLKEQIQTELSRPSYAARKHAVEDNLSRLSALLRSELRKRSSVRAKNDGDFKQEDPKAKDPAASIPTRVSDAKTPQGYSMRSSESGNQFVIGKRFPGLTLDNAIADQHLRFQNVDGVWQAQLAAGVTSLNYHNGEFLPPNTTVTLETQAPNYFKLGNKQFLLVQNIEGELFLKTVNAERVPKIVGGESDYEIFSEDFGPSFRIGRSSFPGKTLNEGIAPDHLKFSNESGIWRIRDGGSETSFVIKEERQSPITWLSATSLESGTTTFIRMAYGHRAVDLEVFHDGTNLRMKTVPVAVKTIYSSQKHYPQILRGVLSTGDANIIDFKGNSRSFEAKVNGANSYSMQMPCESPNDQKFALLRKDNGAWNLISLGHTQSDLIEVRVEKPSNYSKGYHIKKNLVVVGESIQVNPGDKITFRFKNQDDISFIFQGEPIRN